MKLTSRMRKIPAGVKASVAFFMASLITAGISYIVTPIYTRLLTSDEFGRASLFLTWFQIFGIVAMFCLSYGVYNNGMSDYPQKRDEYAFSMLILSNIITVAVFGILLAVYPLISSVLKLDFSFVLLMFAICLVQPAYNFWITRQRYEYKYKMVLVWSAICAITSPLVAILIMLLSKEGSRLYPRIFGAECTLIIIYIGFYIFIGCKNKWRVNTRYWKQAFLFNLPLIPHYLSTYLLGSSDKIMISNIVGDSATAYYTVAHSIASVAIIIWSAINASLVPYTYEKCKAGRIEDVNRVTLPLITLFAIGCVAVIMLAPEAVRIMATAEYSEAIYVIPPIVGGVFFQVQYYIYANVVYYYKKPIYVMAGSASAVVLNIVLNYFCIKKWGYIAAGYTTIICYGLQAFIDFIAMRRVVGTNVYNMKFILLLSLAVVLIALTSNLLYDYIKIRYTILAELVIAMIVFRKQIVSAIRFKKDSKEVLNRSNNNTINQ